MQPMSADILLRNVRVQRGQPGCLCPGAIAVGITISPQSAALAAFGAGLPTLLSKKAAVDSGSFGVGAEDERAQRQAAESWPNFSQPGAPDQCDAAEGKPPCFAARRS
jgi:hypothetical protein